MPTIAERLEQVELKVKRAKEHMGDLKREIDAFLARDPKPYAVVLNRNPEPGKVAAYYMERVEPTPKCFPSSPET